jgi:hypothetical protein
MRASMLRAMGDVGMTRRIGEKILEVEG